MENLVADIRYAFRVLIKDPGFMLVAVIALGLGIGANTAVFSVIERVLLSPLPYPGPDRIVRIQRHRQTGDDRATVSVPKFMAWRQCRCFQSIAAYDQTSLSLNLGGGDQPQTVNGLRVTSGFFDVLGVRPMLGRTFSVQEDSPDGGKFAVLTSQLWKTRFGGTHAIVGKEITLNSEKYVVLGIMPGDYEPDPPTDLYLPEQLDPNSTNQGHRYLAAGRLLPTATIKSATAEINVIAERFRAEHPGMVEQTETLRVVPLGRAIGGEVRPALLILAGAVSFVLLIACANVANLSLARAAGRRTEIAIRTALGCSRGRIIRQLLTESTVVSMVGGAAGAVVAIIGLKTLLLFSPGNIPRIDDPQHAASAMALDWPVLGFLFGISLLSGIVSGIFPAVSVSRSETISALKESSRAGTARKGNRVRDSLVIGEIALALALLAGSALMVRALASLYATKPGFDASNVLTLTTALPAGSYSTTADVESLVRRATERIETLPGVEEAAAAVVLPTRDSFDLTFSIEGREPTLNGKWTGDEQWRYVSPHYFEALRIPLLRGRLFTERDGGKAQHVVIISQAFARKYWPGQDPMGRRMMIGNGMGADFVEPARQIIGIVGNVAETGLRNGVVPVMYIPQSQVTDGLTKTFSTLSPLSWIIRTKGGPLVGVAALRKQLVGIDARLATANIMTLDRVVGKSTVRERFEMLLLSVFAFVALLLSAVGIHGVMSYAVKQRAKEIGIRVALGGTRATITALVLGQSMRLVVIGAVIGLGATYGLTRALKGLMFGLEQYDLTIVATVAVSLCMVALMAAWAPTRRALKVDPIAVLRQD